VLTQNLTEVAYAADAAQLRYTVIAYLQDAALLSHVIVKLNVSVFCFEKIKNEIVLWITLLSRNLCNF